MKAIINKIEQNVQLYKNAVLNEQVAVFDSLDHLCQQYK